MFDFELDYFAEGDLLELTESYVDDETLLELFFNKKKNDTIKIEPKIKPSDAISKIISLINKNLSKPEFKLFKGKIKINPNLTGYYKKFTEGDERYLDIAFYDMQNIIGKYNGDNEDEFWKASDILDELLNNVNNEINQYGYTLSTSDDSEVYGEGGLMIIKGATIKSSDRG